MSIRNRVMVIAVRAESYRTRRRKRDHQKKKMNQIIERLRELRQRCSVERDYHVHRLRGSWGKSWSRVRPHSVPTECSECSDTDRQADVRAKRQHRRPGRPRTRHAEHESRLEMRPCRREGRAVRMHHEGINTRLAGLHSERI